MGMATAFLASNMIYGPNWEVDAAESLLRRAGIEAFATTHSSIEEIASRILMQLGLQREMF